MLSFEEKKMRFLIFTFLLTLNGFSFCQSQVFEGRTLGGIQVVFDNYVESKHKNYSIHIELQSQDVFYRHTTNLGTLLNSGFDWKNEIPEGTYELNITLRSKFTLKVKQVKIAQGENAVVKLNMTDVEGRYRKMRIERDF